jgi:hypothetical protein
MLRASRTILLALAILAMSAIGYIRAIAQDEPACVDDPQRAASMNANERVATAQRPARILLQEGPKSIARSPALRLTLKPIEADLNSGFLVQVNVKNLCKAKGNDPGELLGVVSFFLLKPGEPEDFALPPPEKGFPSVSAQNIELTIKLIPVSPGQKLANVAVEVVKAQFAE